MEIVSIHIDSNAITATSAGNGYAYLGGFVDLEPWKAETFVVARDVWLTILTDDGQETTVSTQTGPGASADALVAAVRAYEENGAAPEGITNAFTTLLRDNGVTVPAPASPS